jgi:hypothetical protein
MRVRQHKLNTSLWTSFEAQGRGGGTYGKEELQY